MKDSLQSLTLMKSVIQDAPLPIGVYVGQELKVVLANDAMITAWGKGEEVIGRKYSEILPELEGQQILSQAQSVYETGIPFHAKNSRVDIMTFGILKTYYYNYSFTPIKDSNSITYAIMNTGADVTSLNSAHKQVEETEEKLRLAVTSAELGSYEVNLLTNTIITSGNFHEIWGTDEDVTREDIIKKIHPEDVEIRNSAHQEALRTGNLCYEARIIPDHNIMRWVRIKGKVIKDSNGNPVTLLGIVQDITEQKEFSNQLQLQVSERTSELKKSNEDLMQFANILSHDLKEPLRKINIFNNLLKHDLVDVVQEKNMRYLDKVQHSTQRMTSIIEGVLSYSLLNKSGHPVEEIQLTEIIHNIKIDLELIIQEKKAIVKSEQLPEIDGAPILIHQLFYNLIHNALKFSKSNLPPQVVITCSTITKDSKPYVCVCIKDNGIGFNPTYADRIFNAFERLHSKDEYEGTGLGLSLCRKIVERHHGTIEAKSNENDGAEFVICLPVKQDNNKI